MSHLLNGIKKAKLKHLISGRLIQKQTTQLAPKLRLSMIMKYQPDFKFNFEVNLQNATYTITLILRPKWQFL